MSEYVQDLDKTEECRKEWDEYREKHKEDTDCPKTFKDYCGYWHNMTFVAHDEKLDMAEKHKFGYARLSEDGKDVVVVVERTNPNAKWDWYVLGGRWTGFFKSKEGQKGQIASPGVFNNSAEKGYVDAALKRDIDFEGMRADARAAAKKEYDTFISALDGETLTQFSVFLDLHKNDIDKAREEYHSQQAVKNVRAKGFYFDLEKYLVGEDQYLSQREKAAGRPFAVIKDGKWYEKGQMGWWGIVTDEKEESEWDEEFDKLIDDLPGDTLLSIYDCHI